MKIGIDIDGVLTNIERWQLDVGSKYFYDSDITIKKINFSEISNIFEIEKDLDTKFWDDNVFDYAENEPARKYAAEIIKKIKEDGNEIYIITARSYTTEDSPRGEKMRNIVTNWLKKNNIYYDKIIFSPHDKIPSIVENKIELMIEDTVRNINSISQLIPVICFHAEYNSQCKGKNIYTAYSWYDIYDKIKNSIK